MQFITTRESLLRPLQLVVGVIDKRPNLPSILSHAMLQVSGNSALFVGSDSEIQISTTVQIDSVLEGGVVAVPAKKLIDICRAAEEKEIIQIKVDQNKANIVFGKSKFNLSVLSANDFPLAQSVNPQEDVVVSAQDFKELLEAVSFATAQQEVRYFLTGVFLEIKNNQIRTVAADGHRLATKYMEFKGKPNGTIKAILPRKAVLELIKLIGDHTLELKLYFSESHFQAICGSTTLTSCLITGKFPSYERLLTKGRGDVAVVDRQALKQAILRASVLFSDKSNGATLSFFENTLKIQASNAEKDQAEEIININYTGAALEAAFNLGYILDFLNIVKGSEVKIVLGRFNDGGVLFEDTSDLCVSYVVMPMRI